MQKAKVILIALFFIANLFAAYDLRFGDGKIVDLVDKLAFAEKIPNKKKNEGNENGGGSSEEIKGEKLPKPCPPDPFRNLTAHRTYWDCRIIHNYWKTCKPTNEVDCK